MYVYIYSCDIAFRSDLFGIQVSDAFVLFLGCLPLPRAVSPHLLRI